MTVGIQNLDCKYPELVENLDLNEIAEEFDNLKISWKLELQ